MDDEKDQRKDERHRQNDNRPTRTEHPIRQFMYNLSTRGATRPYTNNRGRDRNQSYQRPHSSPSRSVVTEQSHTSDRPTRGHISTRGASTRPYAHNRGRGDRNQSNQRPHSSQSRSHHQDENIHYDFMDPKILTDMLQNQSVEAVSDYIIGNMPTFLKVVSDLPEEILILMIRLTAKACGNRAVTSKSFMLKTFLRKKLVSILCMFLSSLLTKDSNDETFWSDIKEVLGCVLTILEGNMQLLPMTSWEFVQTVTKNLSLVLPALHKKPITCEDLNSRITSIQTDLEKIENKFKKRDTKALDNGSQSEAAPEDDFRHLDVFPEVGELTILERPHLRKNVVKGKFASVKDYLDIHFRLLREDFVNPIREDMCDFLNRSNKHLFNIKIHKNVKFLKREIVRGSICYKIKLEISEGLKKVLESGESKRLIHGTLLLFSQDNFKSIICARVCGNDHLKEGYLEVDSYNYVHFDTAYTMIECVLFFEPYYQVLRFLQLLPHDSLPMDRYLVNVNTNVLYPKYLENVQTYKLREGFNPSQKTALHAAMNKEFVIIQGPPGTGKTFLGMELVKMLLSVKPQWTHRGPILIITYTNHALDQFLDGLRDTSNRIIRFGRNSSDIRSLAETCGPESQLKHFLNKTIPKHHLRDDYYVDLVGEEDYVENGGNFFNIRDITRQLAQRVNPDGSITDPNYPIVSVDRKYRTRKRTYRSTAFQIDLRTIPINLRRSLKTKVRLWNSSGKIMEYEDSSSQVKNSLSFIIDNESKAVISPQKLCTNISDEISQFIIPYYFENFDFFRWLFYDDGSIVINQKNGKKETNALEEQEKVFYFLSNFFFISRNQEFGFTSLNRDVKQSYIYLSELIEKANEFEHLIKNQKDRRNLQALTNQLQYIRQKVQYIEFCLKTDFGKPEGKFSDWANPFLIPSKTRWQFYKCWINRCKTMLRQKMDEDLEDYLELLDNHNILKNGDTAQLCNNMDIIAMTTSGAARNRQILELMESPILIVEEAAEVLESHIITALTQHCQHLILLGDHQQLRPGTSDHMIQRKYKLGVSLFERMIENGVECHTLNVQHRMRPEISSLIHPLFYKTLINHSDVTVYPTVTGMTHPLYFIDHMEPEEPYGDSSKMNIHEANFLIQLAVYLIQNNYKAENVTILSTYRGQMYALRKQQSMCALEEVKKIRIAVVDDFQGEENRIILLSLVRSNSMGKIGFLSTENRVCVALSRAKEGFYIMGNMTQLCAASDVWKSIRTTLQSQNAISKFLPLRCKNHKDHETLVSKETDFSKVPEGGCDKPCNGLLNCGHRCIKICHPNDVDHKLYQCNEDCTRALCNDDTHKCKKKCFDKCGRCNYAVSRQLPCGHNKKLPCHVDINSYKCLESIEIQPKCGHVQNIPCHEDTEEFLCKIEVEKTIPSCGHMQMMPCHLNIVDFRCQFEIEFALKCGHKIKKLCSDDRGNVIDPEKILSKDSLAHQVEEFRCEIMMEKYLPGCRHKQNLPCYQNSKDVKCEFVIETALTCGHKRNRICSDKIKFRSHPCEQPCQKQLRDCNDPENHGKCPLPCGKPCKSCTELVIKTYENCQHFEQLECPEARPTRKCTRPCRKNLPCGHKCQLTCSEPCIQKCTQDVFKVVPECGHKQKVKCTEKPWQQDCLQPCSKNMQCGHKCQKRCKDSCVAVCTKQCLRSLDCGHKCIRKCNEKCACRMADIADCGHKIPAKCNEDIGKVVCQEVCIKTLPCGHRTKVAIPCSSDPALQICSKKCGTILACGHPCSLPCDSQCSHKQKCRQECGKQLPCGHPCQNLCEEPCTVNCLLPCNKRLKCGHNCSNVCNKPCDTHAKCESKCEKILSCGHPCINIYGDPCACKILLSIDCEHFVRVTCEEQPTRKNCQQECGKKLDCGHSCKKKCHEDCICLESCRRRLKCGCLCIEQYCSDPCECRNRCSLKVIE